MKSNQISMVAVLLIAGVIVLAAAAAPPPNATAPATRPGQATQPAKVNTAAAPAPRDDAGWKDRFEAINAQAKQGHADLVFIGDSITQGWEGEGKEVWQNHYAGRKALNAGISGDRTQHVLWRLEHGNIDGLHPKLAVIMIGTNNTHNTDNTSEQIAEGITAIVHELRTRLPQTRILLLGVFPRGERPNPQCEKINQVNAIISKLDDGKNINYLDIGKKFLSEDGSISKEIMPDSLHLSPKGYTIWADAIEAKVEALMKDAGGH